MEYPKKELIKEIADLFEDYEETYVPGEWESFSPPQRRYPFFSPWIKVAAALFLMVSVLPFKVKDLVGGSDTALTAGIVKAPGQPLQEGRLLMNKKAAVAAVVRPLAAHPSAVFITANRVSNSSVPVNDNPGIVESHLAAGNELIIDTVALRHHDQALAGAVSKPVVKDAVGRPDTVASVKKNKLSTFDFLASESKLNSKIPKKKEIGSKWDFGILVMPTVTGSNTNVSAGVTTAYRISDKFSLSSGISLLQLESGRNVTPPANSQVSLLSISDKKLLAVDANIKAIDIPIGLIYKVNKHFFTSAGVSFLNVLSEQRSNTYSQTSEVNKMATNLSGAAFSYRAVETDQVAESATDNPLKGNSYLGFFNFSVGRQQHISNRYIIQIEPFIKVPVGKLSAEDLKLMNSGVKFQLSF